MSANAAKRFGEKEDFGVLTSSNVGESSYRQHSLWMAHWTRDGNSAKAGSGKSCSPFEEIDDVGYSKDCGNLPFELMKARVAERLMVGVSHGDASAGSTRQFSSNMWGVAHDICQEVKSKNIEQFDRCFGSSMLQKNVNLYAAKTVVSERFSVHKISDLSVDSRKLFRSDDLSSEGNHFPMLAINRKIDSILKPRRSAFATSSDKVFVPENNSKGNLSTSNVMAFSSKEYQFNTHPLADENMSQCKSAGGILSQLGDHISLNSDHAEKKSKGLSIEQSYSCSKDETNSSCSLADELRGNQYFNSKESPYWSGENNIMFSASRKDSEFVKGSFLKQKLKASEGCQNQDGEEVMVREPVLDGEYAMKPANSSSISKRNDVNINGHGGVFPNLLQGGQQHLNTHLVDSSVNLTEAGELPVTIEKTLIMKSKGKASAWGKPRKKQLTDGKQNVPCLFEMLTLPSKSHATCSKDPNCSGKSGSNTGSCLLGAQKQSSTKTDALYGDTHHASKSTAGFVSTSVQKDSGYPNSAKTERVVASSTKGVSGCSKGNETLIVSSEHQNSYSKASCTNKQEWSIPNTSSMNLDLVLFQISRMRNPISNALTEPPVCSDPSDRWLKRLRHDISDPPFLCNKRPKIGDDASPGGISAVFGGVLDYDYGRDKTAMIKNMEEEQLLHGRLMDQQNYDESPISAKNLNHWIGRWCRGGTPFFHGTSNLGKQASKSIMSPDDPEGQFPSIAAMAMMGRVMNKLRPCELEKRGPSVVWKTEGL